MLNKNLAIITLITLTIGLFTVQAHQGPDPDPIIYQGSRSNLSSGQGREIQYRWKAWNLVDYRTDSQGNYTLGASIQFGKSVYDNEVVIKKTVGGSNCRIKSERTISGRITEGDYYIHAKARGRF